MHARIGDHDIHYQVEGEGPWLTLAHSLAVGSAMWEPQLKALTPHFKVLRFDTRGHGGSGVPTGPCTLEDLADDVRGLYRVIGIEHSHWLGISMGGMIGQTFALKYPGVLTRLVLADSTARAAENAQAMWGERIALVRAKGMRGIADPTLARWFTAPYRAANPKVMARVAALIESTSVEGYCTCCAAVATIDVLGRLPEIDAPALVIVGEQDQATPPRMSRDMHLALAGSELLVLPDAAHLSSIEQAEAFNAAVLSFLLRAHGAV
jgi:3-oxoadipate enol-lactonase